MNITDCYTGNDRRKRDINRVTIKGSIVNVVLLICKFAAGFLGGSAAMVADAVHSLSDFITDIIVIAFVHLGSRPEDNDHDYGHGKYETLATIIISISLLVVGAMILVNGTEKILSVCRGETLQQPGVIALVAALLSIILKEWAYRFTIRAGRKLNSQAVISNAWHHRSDALSSIGTAAGIGGAIGLGSRWAVLDPIAAVVVSLFIIATSARLVRKAFGELMEESLPEQTVQQIKILAEQEPQVSGIHNLRTRSIGNRVAIEMHLRMPGNISLYEAHSHATAIEHRLRDKFGNDIFINIHVEPQKVNGKYVKP